MKNDLDYNPAVLAKRGRLNTGVEPHTGPWTDREKRHLLRRTMFGISKDAWSLFKDLSLEESLQKLLQENEAPPPPVNDYNGDELIDPNVPLGETWINDRKRGESEITSARVVSLKCWWINSMLDHAPTLHEKMIFFWHNHLATQSWEVFWPSMTYDHFNLLREYAFGSFKTMVKKVTVDPHMLLYLNGAHNRKEAPDENYARELQELFCVGKGPEAKFTESDVQAAAKVLTGHSIKWDENGRYLYKPYWHDITDKQFSSFYGNAVIRGRAGMEGAQELDDLMDLIFAQNEVANFIVRKLYRFFVFSDIDEVTEEEVIKPLAQIFRDSDYQIMPVLHTLFSSAHFFDPGNHGAMIKTPLDFLVGFWRTGDVRMPEGSGLVQQKLIRQSMLWSMNNLGLEVLDPPNVAGFPAFYQYPQYDKSWITTNTILRRASMTDAFIFWGFWSRDLRTNIDLISHVESLEKPGDPQELIDELIDLHLGHPISDTVKKRFMDILLSGQQNPSYWTTSWQEYQNDQGNEMKKMTVEVRLKVLFQHMMQLSEYHLF